MTRYDRIMTMKKPAEKTVKVAELKARLSAYLRGGDHAAALAAIRRRDVDYFAVHLWSLPILLRQEGRLAALAGDTIGAVRAHDQHRTLRTDPMTALRSQRDSVRAERAALVSR